MFNVTENKIEITRTKRELVTSIIAYSACAIMFCVYLCLFVLSIVLAVKFVPDADTIKILKFLWVFLQLVAYLVFGAAALIFLYEILVSFFDSPYPLVVDDTGIHVGFLFFNQHIRFEDLKDYGMSYVGKKYDFLSGLGRYSIYSGRNRIVTGRIYRVYFSTKECETDVNTGKKKLRGVKVWWLDVCPLTIHPDAPGGPLFLESVFNFCEAKTGIKPFVPGNAHDFVYRPAKTEEN